MSTELIRGRFLFREVKERGYDLPLGSVTKDGGVEFRSDLDISVWNPGDDVSGYKRVRPDDFVIGLRSFQSGIGHSTIEALVSPAYSVLRPVSKRVHPPYFRYLFKSSGYISRLENVAQGIRQGRTIASEDFYNIECQVPPLSEQRAIADYLDTETARIDALITAKRRMIELLDMRLRAEVDYLLDGLWQRFGSVPVAALCAAVIDCVNKTAPLSAADTPYRMIRTSNIRDMRVDLTDTNCVTRETFEQWNRRGSPRRNDVLLTREAPVGQVGILESDSPVFLGQRTLLYRAAETLANPYYLLFCLWSRRVQEQVALVAAGSLHRHMRVGDCSHLLVPHAPLVDQCSLVEHLRKRLANRDALMAHLTRQIGLLRERRQALITAAVTGELEIPGVAA